MSSSGSGSESDNDSRIREPRPRGLFSDDERSSDDDGGRGHISEAEEDRRASGTGRGDRNTDDEEEEERKKEEQRKKDAEKKKMKPKGPVRRQMISEDMLTGKNGLSKLPDIFQNFTFGGKGKEKDDLNRILSKVEHWIHLLHPKQPFDQSLQRIEFLGLKKKVIKTHMKKIRMGLVSHFDDVDIIEDPGLEDGLEIDVDAIESAVLESQRREEAKESTQQPGTSSSTAMNSNANNFDDEFPDDDELLELMTMNLTSQ